MDVFRTPDERFADLPGYDFEPHYVERSTVFACTTWTRARAGRSSVSTASRPGPTSIARCSPPLVGAGHRVICPDYAGFGRSDKPTDRALVHLRPPRRAGLRSCLAAPRPQPTPWSSSRTGAGRSGCAGRSRTPTASARSSILNTGLFTGRVSKGFMAWRGLRREEPRPAGRLRDPVGGPRPSSPTTSSPPTRRPSPTPPSKAGAAAVPAAGPDRPMRNPEPREMRAVADELSRWEKPALRRLLGQRTRSSPTPGAARRSSS